MQKMNNDSRMFEKNQNIRLYVLLWLLYGLSEYPKSIQYQSSIVIGDSRPVVSMIQSYGILQKIIIRFVANFLERQFSVG